MGQEHPEHDKLSEAGKKALAEFTAWLHGPEYQKHLARILEEIANDPDIAVGHCGSYT